MKRIIVTDDGWLSQYIGKKDHGGIVRLVFSDAARFGYEISHAKTRWQERVMSPAKTARLYFVSKMYLTRSWRRAK